MIDQRIVHFGRYTRWLADPDVETSLEPVGQCELPDWSQEMIAPGVRRAPIPVAVWEVAA